MLGDPKTWHLFQNLVPQYLKLNYTGAANDPVFFPCQTHGLLSIRNATQVIVSQFTDLIQSKNQTAQMK